MKRWMRALLLLMAVVLMAGTGTQPARAEMLDMTDFNDGVITVSKVPRGKAGNKISIKMTVHNEAETHALREIRLANSYEYERMMEQEFGSDDDEDEDEDGNDIRRYNQSFPFEADSSTFDPKKINVNPESSKSISMSYKLRRDLPEGYYQAFFIIDESIEVGVNIWVSAYDGSSTEDEEIGNSEYEFSTGDGQLTPYGVYGQVLNYEVNVTHMGSKKAFDVRVDMQLDADVTKFPFDINEGNYIRRVGDMEPGQMSVVAYSMAVREDVESGFFPITYRITYREEEGGDFAEPVDKVVYVRVKGEDDEELDADAGEQDRTKARLIVDSFETIPGEIFAGQPFELKVRMKNASTNVAASNIMFTFNSEEVESSPIFTSDTGSTSVVVNDLAPGEVAELTMIFKAEPTAEQKSYRMTIVEQYDSPEFKNAKEEVKISLPVRQEPRLNTSTIDVMPESINVGSESNVMFGINNTGKVLLYNVMARFEADSIQITDTYVGNVKPGETGNVDAMLTGIAPTVDDGKVKIIISYEDENGVVTEVEKEMTLFVNEMMDEFAGMDGGMGIDAMGGMDEMEAMAEEQGFVSRFWKPMAALAAVAVLGVLAGIKIRKKRKAEAEEEGMDDEIL